MLEARCDFALHGEPHEERLHLARVHFARVPLAVVHHKAVHCVGPSTASFPFIWREAMEVHWDPWGQFLYSPNPREWSYAKWFRQITAAAGEQGYD